MTHEQAVEIVARAGWLANEDGHAVLYSDLHRLDQHLVAQAEQLRELRERMEKIKARSDPNREQRQSEPQIVLDSIYAHACAALARGGTTE